MDTTTLIVVWIVIVGVIAALVAWFGPRPSQWRTHEGVDESGNGQELQDESSETDIEPIEPEL